MAGISMITLALARNSSGGSSGGMISQYDAESTYESGDVVSYGKGIYICNEPITTPEPWNPEKWSKFSLDFAASGEVQNIINNYGV